MKFLPAIQSQRCDAFDLSRTEVLQRLSSRGHTLVELLKAGAITKIYLDYDHVIPDRAFEAGPLCEADILPHYLLVKERMRHIIECLHISALESTRNTSTACESTSDCISDQEITRRISYTLACRHGWCATKSAWKISMRPFVLGVCIRYDHIPSILRVTGQIPAADDPVFWDLSVYKPNEQLLACINGVKSASDTRLLVPDNDFTHSSVLDFVAQSVDDDWRLLTVPTEMVSRDLMVLNVTNNKPRDKIRCNVSYNLLARIVNGLSVSRAIERKAWIETIWAIHAVSVKNEYEVMGESIAHSFSRKFMDKYDARTVTSAYRSGRIEGSCFDIGSLLYWLKQDTAHDPTIFTEVQSLLSMEAPLMIVDETDEVLISVSRNDLSQDTASIETIIVSGNVSRDNSHIRDMLMLQLAARWPEHFMKLNKTSFEISFRGGVACFSDGRIRGYIKDYSVCLADGTFLGLLCNDVPVKGPLPLHKEVPPHLNFLFNRETSLKSSLTADDPTDASLSVYEYNTSGMKDFIEINVKGRRTVNVDNRKKVDELQKYIANAIRAHVESVLGPQSGNWLFINNGTINITPGPSEKTISDFRVIRDKLVEFAACHGLRKKDGMVYEPVVGCPCAYAVRSKYEEYINEVLKDDDVFNDNPRRFDEALKFLTNYEVTKMPWLKADTDLISFSNGVLVLTSGDFVLYSGLEDDHEMVKRVARHHINLPYTDCESTPLLDIILTPQFDEEVAEVLCALLGRTFFKLGRLDSWQVMPFLVGVGGTGKSLLLNIMEELFAKGSVGNLAARREEVFGMANLADKEVVFGRDMPAKMSACLPQETMQAMTAGEGMEIPRKGLMALNVRWTAPVIMASNHMPDYANTGNNVGRRMVSIRFDNVIINPMEDLQQSIMSSELPNIVCRVLGAYKRLRSKIRSNPGGFWGSVPSQMIEWRQLLTASTNKLNEFLSMEDDDRKVEVTRVVGMSTSEIDFKIVFEARMGKGTYVADPAVFASFGFRYLEKALYVCMSCKQISKGGAERCCEMYSQTNRRKKRVISDMSIMFT